MYRTIGKWILDRVGALCLLLALSPLMAAVAAVVWISLGRPVLFRQPRAGKNGKIFRIAKFRTMKDADGGTSGSSDGRRMTRIGRALRAMSLDELPELMHVLSGKMSLIGPRPLLVEYLDLYTARQARRHEVRPGITGWAQVNGRNQLDWEQRFEHDVWYVDNMSFVLDLKIFLRTILAVLWRDGVSARGHDTMPKFTGSGDSGPG